MSVLDYFDEAFDEATTTRSSLSKNSCSNL